jgi:hypothetical protein
LLTTKIIRHQTLAETRRLVAQTANRPVVRQFDQWLR